MKILLLLPLLFLGGAAAQDATRVAEKEAMPHPAPRCVAPDCVILKRGETFSLPDAPSSSRANDDYEVPLQPRETLSAPDLPPHKPGFWEFGRCDADNPLRTNHEVFHDKTWQVAQSFWMGSIVYDVEATHQGIAHHKCVEANDGLNIRPSRFVLYRDHIAEYAAGTAFSLAMLKYVSKALLIEFPAMSSVGHLRGGSEWFMDCW